MSKGMIPKQIAASHLACRECKYFNDADDDIYYCELDREHFPGLCEQYEPKNHRPDERNYFIGLER